MAGALIIVLREAVEAGLIIGIVLAVTRGMPSRTRYVASSLAAVLGLAVIMLAWHNIWVARHGRQMSEDMRRLGRDVMSGARSLMALAVVVGLAVLREGSEVVPFPYGVIISSGESGLSLLLGGVLGLLLGAGISPRLWRPRGHPIASSRFHGGRNGGAERRFSRTRRHRNRARKCRLETRPLGWRITVSPAVSSTHSWVIPASPRSCSFSSISPRLGRSSVS